MSTHAPRTVIWFAGEMMDQLEDHAYKGDSWKDETVSWLLNRLRQELGELKRVIEAKRPAAIVCHEAADVANFAMFVADVYSAQNQE